MPALHAAGPDLAPTSVESAISVAPLDTPIAPEPRKILHVPKHVLA